MSNSTEIVICGAGIAGISTAYYLAQEHGINSIKLIDERPPLSLTSDKSSECYRNWWPGPGDAMVALSNRSIDLMEAIADRTGNRFNLNRRGYLYLTAQPERIASFVSTSGEISNLGAGPLRIHTGSSDDPKYIPSSLEGYKGIPDGADLFTDGGMIKEYFPYVSQDVVAALHIRRAGWFSAQQLGMHMLNDARIRGVEVITGRVVGVDVTKGKVTTVKLSTGERIGTSIFVNAAGPYIKQVSELFEVDIPVFCELHLKVAIRDPSGALPRNAPLLIWSDPQTFPWDQEERVFLSADQETSWLLNEFPPGGNTRPEGGLNSDIVLFLWEYQPKIMEPIFPVPIDDEYQEIALRGMAKMIPALTGYIDKAPRPRIDGGYYTKTHENRPLIGPLPVPGTYIIGALSGYGLMVACAAGELLAAHITGSQLPKYADTFLLQRYEDPRYQSLLSSWHESGQL